MGIIMDIVEINDDIDIQELNFDLKDDIIDDKPSVNFGSGIELLMNDKTKNENKGSTNIDINDINKLENELNELNDVNLPSSNIKLTSDTPNLTESINEPEISTTNVKTTDNKKTLFGNFNLFGNHEKKDGKNVKSVNETKESLGKSTSKFNETKTWDGYSKVNNVPDNIEPPKLSKEQEIKEKFKY